MNIMLMQKTKHFYREQVMGVIILACLGILILSVILVNLLDVKVLNIEQADRGLYTIVTNKGPVNVVPDDIVRIERTYTKTAVTGNPVELDKIYTIKGFIYVSSLDPFAPIGQQLINSVDYEGKPIWERAHQSWETVQKYGYAIGTPNNQIPFLFLCLLLQYLSLSIGGLALAILIFPLRVEEEQPVIVPNASEQDFHQEDSSLGAVAK